MIKRLKNNITLLNVVTNLILQICTIVSGFIIPKIILSYFGSEVNGLISSITQFLSYISLIEGGVTGVITANLYKPLCDGDVNKISSIIKTSNKFYRKVGIIFLCYSIILAIIYPILFSVNFSYIYVFALTIVLSLNLFIQYMFSLTLKTLLNADKKVYVVAISQTIIIVASIVLSIVSVNIYTSVHLLKLLTGALYVIQPIIYRMYINKNYKIIKEAKEDKNLIKSRWNGFAINIAAFIHFGTDIVILTIFTDLSTVSIYSVYSLVTAGLRQIINSISTAITPTIGQLYAKGEKMELEKKFNIYEYIIFTVVFLFFSVAGLLIVPFVMIYTKNITDTNYYQPLFGILLVISEGLYLIKFPHLNLSYVANKFKQITLPAFFEATINIVLSLILVKKLELAGVAIGTICAMLYRMIFHVYYTKKIINRSQKEFYKIFIIYSVTSLIGIIICIYFVPKVQYNIISWILHGIIYTIILSILYIIIGRIFYNKEYSYIIKQIRKV